MSEKTYTVADYREMIEKTRASIKLQFPNEARDIYVVDQSQPVEDELKKIAEHFGDPKIIDMLKDKKLHQGDGPRHDGVMLDLEIGTEKHPRTVYVAYSWGYGDNLDSLKPDTKIDSDTFTDLVKVNFHETYHALYHATKMEDRFADLHLEDESLPEAFAVGMLINQGLWSRTNADTYMANYDARKVYDSDGKIDFRNTWAKDKYDPSDELLNLMSAHPEIRKVNLENQPTFPMLDMFLKIEEVAKRTSLNKQDSAGGEQSFINSKRILWQFKEDGKTEEEIRGFIAERPLLFPGQLNKADNANSFLKTVAELTAKYNKEGVKEKDRFYPEYQTTALPRFDLKTIMAEAWIKQAKSGDPFEIMYADDLVHEYFLARIRINKNEYSKFESAIQSDRNESSWAQAILDGKSPKEVVREVNSQNDEKLQVDGEPPKKSTQSVSEAPDIQVSRSTGSFARDTEASGSLKTELSLSASFDKALVATEPLDNDRKTIAPVRYGLETVSFQI